MKKRFGHILIILLCMVWLVGCTSHGTHGVGTHPADVLNRKAYAWRYRNLDSTYYYASMAHEAAGRYTHGLAMACNTLGFVACMQMNYEAALHWYDEVDGRAGCELERLVADVGRMNVYLRTADNLAFYDCRVRAAERLRHINEEVSTLSAAERTRLNATVNDMHMVMALHHHRVGQRPEAHAEMRYVVDDDALHADSAQWLMYVYLKGIGLDVEGDTYEQRLLRRYTYLNSQCLRVSQVGGYSYFTGLALSGLSELLADSSRVAYIAFQRPNSFAQLGDSAVCSAEGLSMALVADAMCHLDSYGDRYGIMNAMVQMASLHNSRGHYQAALDTLQRTLDDLAWIYSTHYLSADSVAHLTLYATTDEQPVELGWLASAEGRTVPDILCRLREEASLAFAGWGDKVASDYNRNIYLDLLEMTRQDKELESRYLSLKRQQRMITVLLCAILGGAALLGVLIVVLSKHRRTKGKGYEQQLRDLLEETEKRVCLQQRHIEVGKRGNVVRKATLSMVTGMMPYIDRMAHEVDRLQLDEVWRDEELRARKLEYIDELAGEINHLNEVLAQWIKTTQGVVGLHIESFPLAEVFDMIARGNASFALKGLTLEVRHSDAVVKADKALTFFMLNTLADNARKFTPEGGRVSITAEVGDEYVELSVADTGVGMSAADISCILNEKVYDAASIGHELPPGQRKNKGGGFGLLNCKGIIEKYRKTDPLFEVCRMGIDSRVGEGSRFWFRLPKGVRRLMTLLCLMVLPLDMLPVPSSEKDSCHIGQDSLLHREGKVMASYSPLLMQASAYADSVYYANIDGRYEAALSFADSALSYLNAHHRQHAAEYIAPLTATRGEERDVELRWWFSDFATDYHTILDVRNEMAVANLALQRWGHYRYNNRIYNDLYKVISEDRSFIDYCDRMQRYNSNISLAVLICVLLVLGYVAVLVYTFMGRVEHVYRDIESVEDEERRARHEENRLHVQNMVLDNCLSTIKHETVYYPNRIKQLVEHLDGYDKRKQMKELVDYYKVVFTTLANCASRQLDEVTFRRSDVEAEVLARRAASYYAKLVRRSSHDAPTLAVEGCRERVWCDANLAGFLLEQLIDVALVLSPSAPLSLRCAADDEFVRFTLFNASCDLSPEVLPTLFSPSHMSNAQGGVLQGAAYVICRQIIREHDTQFNHIGCRIKAEPIPGGYAVWFTLPRVAVPSRE